MMAVISWNWVVAISLAVALGVIAWLQILENQSNQAQQVAVDKARAEQHAIDVADANATISYLKQYSAPGPHPGLPSPEEFSKTLAGGRELIRVSERDWIYQNTPHGMREEWSFSGAISTMHFEDLKYFADSNTNAVMPPYRPVQRVLLVRSLLPCGFFIVWALFLIRSLSTARPISGHTRVVCGQWLIGLSFTLLFVPVLDPMHIVASQFTWGIIAAIVTAALYIVSALIPQEPDHAPRCGKCRYNLTGNASGICPECGTPVESAMAQK